MSAVPSYSHMAYVKLMESGLLKFVVSQNVDGLHRKSGIPPEKLAELHGNVNLERCGTCGKEYMRDFEIGCSMSHHTGRKCTVPGCSGDLFDSIINFGENLPKREIREGFDNCLKADVCLAMGSSLRVTPAADMPAQTAEKGGKLIVVKYLIRAKVYSLQKTPLDSSADMVIHAMCDDVMRLLMKNLALEPQPFQLRRRVRVAIIEKYEQKALLVEGTDSDGTPYSLFSQVDITLLGKKAELKTEPFITYMCAAAGPSWFQINKDPEKTQAVITLHFQGHYAEPPMTFPVQLRDLRSNVYVMEYNPMQAGAKTWDSLLLVKCE